MTAWPLFPVSWTSLRACTIMPACVYVRTEPVEWNKHCCRITHARVHEMMMRIYVWGCAFVVCGGRGVSNLPSSFCMNGTLSHLLSVSDATIILLIMKRLLRTCLISLIFVFWTMKSDSLDQRSCFLLHFPLQACPSNISGKWHWQLCVSLQTPPSNQ